MSKITDHIAEVDDTDDLPTDPAAIKAWLKTELNMKRVTAAHVAEAAEAIAEILGENEDEEPQGGSVVKSAYKKRYAPHHNSCGDDLAREISAHVTMTTPDGADRISHVALRAFAEANDVWSERYQDLNIGMQRMNIRNRLAAKVRKGHEVVWA